jgi:hypothetical protein
LDPTPSSLEAVFATLPARIRAELAWFPQEFRGQFLTRLRNAAPHEIALVADDLVRPAVLTFLRLGHVTATLFAQDASIAELFRASQGDGFRSIRGRARTRLGPIDPRAADDLDNALAWLGRMLGALLADFQTALSLHGAKLEAFEVSALDEELPEELPTAVTYFYRALLLTIGAAEVVAYDAAPLPSNLGIWCRMAATEVQAAANVLRAEGLPVPTALIEEQHSSQLSLPGVVRPHPLPGGVLETLVDELAPEGTHGPESDWDVLVVVPDDQPEDLAARPGLVALRRAHVELFVVHRSNFEDAREVVGTLSHTASTQGRLVYGR